MSDKADDLARFTDARILVVDDEMFHARLLQRLLMTAGYKNITTSADSREVEALHRANDYDLILLDVHMPHLSGIDLIDRLKWVDSLGYAPVIIMTGDEDRDVRHRALERGARDFLVKPPDKAELLSRIQNLLEVRYLTRQNRTERTRYQQLLQNILPGYLLARLNEGDEDVVDDFADVSVFFADLVGFSNVCARLESRIVVANLNHIFLAMDRLAEHYGVEKIKTIGDAYMAISGIGTDDPTHFVRMADFAVAAIQELEALQPELAVPFQMRVGIERGQLIAGMLKGARSVFDVWGDTVNIAARLQSASTPGRAIVSRYFADAVADEFVMEPNGHIDLKGVGRMETLFLVSRKLPSNRTVNDSMV